MKNIKVKLFLVSKESHLCQILTGFMMLKDQGLISLDVLEDNNRTTKPCEYFIEAEINGIKVGYDAMDGYNDYLNFDDYLDSVDYYFKRSYSDSENLILRNKSKIRPLGLFYRVHYPNLPIFPKKGLRDQVLDILRFVSGRDYRFYPHFFESRPTYKIEKEPNIFFTTRLWNPNGEPDEIISSDLVREERLFINETRIELIRKLKEKYGNRFFGGVSNTSFSKQVCQNLILNDNLYRRDNYIRNMKRNFDICIGSSGLHHSIGGKIGEYVAASKCIVTEKFTYTATPEFEERKNYFSYSTINECLDIISKLEENHQLIRYIEENNYEYYKLYLKPDRLIYNTILQVLNIN